MIEYFGNLEHILKWVGDLGEKILFFNITGSAAYKIPFLVAWIAIMGIYFSISFKFVNIRYFLFSLKTMLSRENEKKQISTNKRKLKSMTTSKKIVLTGIGEAIDVSAIFGVTTAVIIGGPGVLFWIFAGIILSMPIRFVEVALGNMTRKIDVNNKVIHGGPERYISLMFKVVKMPNIGRFVACLFSICVIVSTFFSLQVNQTINVVRHIFPEFNKHDVLISICLATLIMAIISTGFNAIASVASRVVKFMSLVYISVSLIIILKHADQFQAAIFSIFTDAFSFRAIQGSLLFAIITGMKRLFFSCDVGQGMSSIIHINSINKNPIQEGIISMSAISIIGLISIFCSGLIVIVTGAYLEHVDAMSAVVSAFDTVHPLLKHTLFIIVPLFAITTAISWGYFGQRSWQNIFGVKSVFIYNILLFFAYIACGVTKDFGVILDIADIFNFSITIPNMIALIIGSKYVRRRYNRFSAFAIK